MFKIPERIPTPGTSKLSSYQARDTKCSTMPLGTSLQSSEVLWKAACLATCTLGCSSIGVAVGWRRWDPASSRRWAVGRRHPPDGHGRTAHGGRPWADSQWPSHLLKFSPLRGSKFFSTKKLLSVPLKNHLPLSSTILNYWTGDVEEDAQFVSPSTPCYRCFPFSSKIQPPSFEVILARFLLPDHTCYLEVARNYSSCCRFSVTFACTSEAKKILKVVVLKQAIPTRHPSDHQQIWE
jgi:hypothetical protein